MRKLALFSFAFSAAIFLVRYALRPDWLIPASALFLILGLLALFLKGDSRPRAALAAFGLAAGFIWNCIYLNLFIEPFMRLDGQTTVISGEVADYPRKAAQGVSLYVKVESQGAPFTAKTLLYADAGQTGLAPGDRVKLKAKIYRSNISFGQESDYYTSSGVFLIAYAKGDPEIVKAASLPLKYYPQYLSKALRDKISEIYPDDTAPFMTALLSGDRSQLSKDHFFISAMSSAGVSHVVAVSGMHISFLAGFITLLMRSKRRGALVSAPIILLFMAMTGSTPSVVRASIMQLFLLLAPFFRRENDTFTSLGAALMLLLVVNPYSAANAGLQLSFASVAGIALFSSEINAALLNLSGKSAFFENRIISGLWKLISASLSSSAGALIFTTPLMAVYFNKVSLVAPLSNLIVLPPVSLAFCGGLVSVLTGFIFSPAGKAAAWLVSWPVRFIFSSVQRLSGLQFASVSMLSVFLRLWLVFTYAVLARLFIIRKRKPRLIIPACGIIIALCLSILLSGLVSDRAKMTVTAVDVGQGAGIVITARAHTFVIDCGGGKSANVGNNTAEYLHSVNRNVIDALVITHFDTDHINGVALLMQKCRVKLLAMPKSQTGREDNGNLREKIISAAHQAGTEILYIEDNYRLYSDYASLSLFPVNGSSGDNDNGLTVLCSAGDYDTLIMGDADAATEKKLIRNVAIPDIEVLVVGHHGSKYSTSEEFLDAVKPEKAIISVGYNNYGHPSGDVLERLASRSIAVFRTDISGNVTVRSN